MTTLREKSKQTRKHTFECKVCSKVCLGAQDFRVHFLTHGSSRPYKCEQCSQTFKSKDSHQRHLYKHEGKKPFLCATCGKGFSTNQILKEHTAIHNDEMLYSCSLCDRAFRHNSALSRHLLVHQSQPGHMCHVCGQLFLNAAYLSSHMRSHSGERCFTCKICFHQFKHASSLSRHCSQHHKDPKKNEGCSVCPDSHFSIANSLLKHKIKFHSETNNSQDHEVRMLNKNKLSSICEYVSSKKKIQESNAGNGLLGKFGIPAQSKAINSELFDGLHFEQFSLEGLLQLAQKCQTIPTPVNIHIFRSMTHIMKQLADNLAGSNGNMSTNQFQQSLTVLSVLQSVVNKNLLFIKENNINKLSGVK